MVLFPDVWHDNLLVHSLYDLFDDGVDSRLVNQDCGCVVILMGHRVEV